MKNKYGLSRKIKDDIKLSIRQKCGFGCTICGNAIIQYHHFDPPFSEAKSHSVEGITTLCGTCHDMAHKEIIPLSLIVDADSKPYCKNKFSAKSKIFLGNTSLPVQLGSSLIQAESIIMYDNDVIFGFEKPEYNDSPIRLNATFMNNEGIKVLNIKNNEWIVGSDCFNIEIVKSKLIIKNNTGEVNLEMSLSIKDSLKINKIDMLYKGFKIFANESSFNVKVPRGSSFNHTGSNLSEIGIWMKSNGQALIAANRSGGAAICLG